MSHADAAGKVRWIAQGLIDVAANSTALFSPFLDPSRLVVTVNQYLGLPLSTPLSCATQLSLIGGSNGLGSMGPARRSWARVAILWDAGMTETNSGLLAFASALDFRGVPDAPGLASPAFQFTSAGYGFDLLAMTVSTSPSSWLLSANPPPSQANISASSLAMLDRLNSFAVAASTQRSSALVHTWSELGLDPTLLPPFVNAVASAEVVLTSPFLPLACSAGLSNAQLIATNAVEVNAFTLPPVTPSTSLDPACTSTRPLYGVSNLFDLASPFTSNDPRSNLPQQRVVLPTSERVRLTWHAGELLSGALAGGPVPTPSSPSLPDRFGTANALHHVVLAYLNLMPPALARQVVQFVLSDPVVPLLNSTLYHLSQGLLLIPTLEVNLWGGL